jgi:hypothetical protein
MRNFSKSRVLLLLIAPLLLAGCATVKIGRILDQPDRYQNRIVRVEGRVDHAFGGVVTGVYQVQDNTGKIYVLSNGGVPRTGTRVTVKGTVMSGITIGTHSFATSIREERHKVHY